MLKQLLEHHILANLAFVLVLASGIFAYLELPREQDPSINLNWVDIKTYWPGAAAKDVEERVTEPLEEGIEKVRDIEFVSSISRSGVSSILIRFDEVSEEDFDQRMSDLRREVLAKFAGLPPEVEQPEIVEISSSNVFPAATLIVWGQTSPEQLQFRAKAVKDSLERLDAVDRVVAPGYTDPELQVHFHPLRLVGLGVSPVDVADSVSAYFQDLAAGRLDIGEQNWLVRLKGTTPDPAELARFPIVTDEGELPLSAVADVISGRADPRELVTYQGHQGVLLLVFKEEKANSLELIEEVNDLIGRQNELAGETGVQVDVLDDRTAATQKAIDVMEFNALIGLMMVLTTVGVFLGLRVSLVSSIGIPFVLAGTFAIVFLMGQTLNSAVLVGIVISLGMLVDDAIVVADALHSKLSGGMEGFQAVRESLREVMAPVTSAVLTTIAAFLPLIFMPGVLGDFMRIVPIVVSIALLISLLEVFWMLPSHTLALYSGVRRRSRIERARQRIISSLRHHYSVLLLQVLRAPKRMILLSIGILGVAVGSLASGMVKVDFFAGDFHRLFYVNVEMPAGTSLEKTLDVVRHIEEVVVQGLPEESVRGVVSYAGHQMTDKEVLAGDDRGQVFVSLSASGTDDGSIDDMIQRLRGEISAVPGPRAISFLQRKVGPPTTKPVSIKVRGTDIEEIRAATAALKDILAAVPGVRNVTDDDVTGGRELALRLDPDAVVRAGVHPADVVRMVRLFVDGEVAASMQHRGEEMVVRVRAEPSPVQDIDAFLAYPVPTRGGGQIALGDLMTVDAGASTLGIRHHDFKRAVTVEADIDKSVTNTLATNRAISQAWGNFESRFPGVNLDFTGELDDIQESLGAMGVLFVVGVLLIFLILATQFKSYLQPMLILATVPMAFVGVVAGLLITGNPLSLYTLYGVIALAGIAANNAIVLISTANRSVRRGSPVGFSIVLAARRRLIPILVTTLTTIAGLSSLAAGFGGKSLMWSPLATAIVWGLGISSLLTLSLIPLLYSMTTPAMRPMLLGSGSISPKWGDGRRKEGHLTWLWQDLLSRLSGRRRALEMEIPDQVLRAGFQASLRALESRDFDTAIRGFERLAKKAPDSFAINLFAGRANIALMEQIGWDTGYYERAERYLARAEAQRPDDEEVLTLKTVLRRVKASA